MPHFSWIGKSGVGISGFLLFPQASSFHQRDPESSIVSSLCAQLRYKVPLEEMKATIEFLKRREGLGVTCLPFSVLLGCLVNLGLIWFESNKKEGIFKALLCPG